MNLGESIKAATDASKTVSEFDELYRRAMASVGGYYAGIYVIVTRESGTYYFMPFLETRSHKSFKGLHVVHYPDKSKPGKAIVAHRGLDGTRAQPASIPPAVLERFAEASSKL